MLVLWQVRKRRLTTLQRGIKGVATGATTSKVLGMDYAVKTGLGIQTYSSGDLEIAVICGVNPLGDIMENGKIIAGAKDGNGEFIGAQQVLSSCCFNAFSISNTTIGCILLQTQNLRELKQIY